MPGGLAKALLLLNSAYRAACTQLAMMHLNPSVLQQQSCHMQKLHMHAGTQASGAPHVSSQQSHSWQGQFSLTDYQRVLEVAV
jgi:hypothetical protein